jgi:hypothetical protein
VRRLLSAVLLVALAGASHAAAAAPRNFDRVYSDAVHEMRGCLDVLPAGERRLVVLRSGLGPGDPVSPKAAAAKLKIKAGQVGHRAWGAVRT